MERAAGQPMNTSLATDLVNLGTSIAHEVGAVALAGRKRGLREVSTKSTSTDMVTEYDKLTEASIITALRAARPNDSIVAEEGGGHNGDSGITWFVDPIDGTTNFLYDLPTWTVSLGAHDADGELAAVVFCPPLNETYTATRGGGAFLNGTRIYCNEINNIAHCLIATGFNYSPDNRLIQAARIPKIIANIRDIRRLGSASLDLCFVAVGRYDAYYEEHLFPWDLAAGTLIAKESGCTIGSIDGGEVQPSAILASPPGVFTQIQDLIKNSNS
jgi:myo-inositol-1(or 4)-monophosphatase